MSRAFDPKKVLKHISNPLLREFFDRRGELRDVPWDDLTEHRIDPVFDAWEALPDGKANEVQCILREVHALASESGAKALAEVIAEHLPVRQNEFAAIGSKHDKALWCCLHAPKLFEMASVFAEADGLEAGNQWKTRNGLPRGPLDVTPARIAALEGEVKAFFSTRELRGRHCHVAHHSRPCGTEYFFAYLDDYPDRDMVFEEGSDVPVPLSVRSAFQVVFAFDTKRVEVLPLHECWPGWWSKIELFRPGLLTGPTLYLDLDVVVTGDVAPLFRACDQFTMVHERGKTDYFNSSAMAWTGDMGHVFEAFRRDPAGHMERFRRHPRIGDQAFISDLLVREGRAPRTFRRVLGYDAIVSYKGDHCEGGPPPRACIVNFHGTPKPCDFKTGWVADGWDNQPLGVATSRTGPRRP